MLLPKTQRIILGLLFMHSILVFGNYSSGLTQEPTGQKELYRELARKAMFFHTNESGGFSTVNKSQQFTADLRIDGFTTRHKDGEWEVHNQIIGLGRTNNILELGPGEFAANELELMVHFPYADVQYQHSVFGLRQNFILHSAPKGEGAVVVQLKFESSLNAVLSGDKSLLWKDDEGAQVFSYEDLKVWDSKGTLLDAYMELSKSNGDIHLALIVNDHNASYPITIDPVSTVPNRLLQGTQSGAEFGVSASTAGDVNGDGFSDIVVGAWKGSNGQSGEGLAFVYYGSESGIGATPDVTLEIDQANAEFGCAVNTAGDVNGDGYSDIIIGARRWENSTSTFSEGAAFIYHGGPTGISTTYDQFVESNLASSFMGSNVSSAGDIDNDGFSDIIVGAYLSSLPTNQEGAAYVYRGTATGLVLKHRLDGNHGGAHMSRSVSSAGDINGDGYSDVIIGASQYDNLGLNDGRVFVWYGSANGLGGGGMFTGPQASLSGSGIQSSAFGWSVSSAGDLNGDGYSDVAVGAYRDRNGNFDEGRIYVYHGTSVGLLTTPAIILESNQVGAWMGRSLCNVGDVNGDGFGDLAIGIPLWDQGEVDEGAVNIYFGSPSGISAQRNVYLQLNNSGANFGESVRAAGDVNGDGYSDIIGGAKLYGSGGAVAIFHGGAYNVETTPSIQTLGDAASDHLGQQVAAAGDVNGDGLSDIIIAAPDASSGQTNEGLVYIYESGVSGLNPTPKIIQRNQANAHFGKSVSTAGDVNGDGYADVLLGSPDIGTGGAVYVYHGSAAGLATIPSRTLTGAAGSDFGHCVSNAGDINSDGYADVIIGAPNSNSALLYLGSPSGLNASISATLTGPNDFGWSVSSAGDVNGDGFSDVAVGTPNSGNGIVRVFHGEVAGLIVPHAIELTTTNSNAEFGYALAAAGDVNGDGFFDLAVGAPNYTNGHAGEGALIVHFGTPSGLSSSSNVRDANIAGARMGESVDGAGDVNGDGYADIIIGAPFASNNASTPNEGHASLYQGQFNGVGPRRLLQFNISGMLAGSSVAGAGDTDGDGFSDVIVGAPGHSPSLTEQGSFNVFRGNEARGNNHLTRQYQANLVSPLATNSMDFSDPDHFGIGHFARNATHRSLGRLHWEIAFQGAAWGGSPITNNVVGTDTSATWTDLGTLGVEIKELIFKEPGEIRYKWRVRVEYELTKAIDGQRYGRWYYGFSNQHSDIGVLPVELLTFTGMALENSNRLEWISASEIDLSHYEIQRAETNMDFISIGNEQAIGGNFTSTYRFEDDAPLSGISFYRLRMIDISGNEEYSEVIAIEREKGVVAVYPNPAHNILNISASLSGTETLQIIDAAGRTVSEYKATMLNGSINVSHLHSGWYTIHLIDNWGKTISRSSFTKQ